jgi:hypothetical protein
MWQNEEWILPTFNQEPRYDKPPLHYYAFTLAYKLFGITPFAARFFPAFLGFATSWVDFHLQWKDMEEGHGKSWIFYWQECFLFLPSLPFKPADSVSFNSLITAWFFSLDFLLMKEKTEITMNLF